MSVEINLETWADSNPDGVLPLTAGDELRFEGYVEHFFMELLAPDIEEWGLSLALALQEELRRQTGIVTHLLHKPLVIEVSEGVGTVYACDSIELEIVEINGADTGELRVSSSSVSLQGQALGFPTGGAMSTGGGASGGAGPLVVVLVVALAAVAIAGIGFGTVYLVVKSPELSEAVGNVSDTSKLAGVALVIGALAIGWIALKEGSAGVARIAP